MRVTGEILMDQDLIRYEAAFLFVRGVTRVRLIPAKRTTIRRRGKQESVPLRPVVEIP
jgi:hypothetical protein